MKQRIGEIGANANKTINIKSRLGNCWIAANS